MVKLLGAGDKENVNPESADYKATSDESSNQSSQVLSRATTQQPRAASVVESTVHMSSKWDPGSDSTDTFEPISFRQPVEPISSKLSTYGESELQLAAAKGDLNKVRQCIKEGMSCFHRDYNRLTPLHDAVKGRVRHTQPTPGPDQKSGPDHFCSDFAEL